VASVPLSVVADLRRARQKQRVAQIHWVDALYNVYMAGIIVIVVVAVLSTVIGDGRLKAAQVASVQANAPALLGVLVALAVFVGLRSGSRGGPLAVEKADVRHILMAPVDRGGALRGPALRQLRFMAFTALAVGAASGQFAGRRFTGHGPEWVLCGALFGLVVASLSIGAALTASSRRLPQWAATLVGGVLVVWSIADASHQKVPIAPATFAGRIAIWPLHFDPISLIPIGLAVVLVLVGLAGIAGVSLEAAERRSSLVGQLRFAVTLQDLRTVMVLRRQLAADLPRSRPWLKVRRKPGQAHFPIWQRGWRGVLRWPLPRILRLVGVGVAAGFVVHYLFDGVTPVIPAAGILLWIAGLDAVEPLAQDVDHPSRRDAYPMDEGHLMVRHVPVSAAVMILVGLVTAGTSAALTGSTQATEVMFIAAIPMALAGCGGAIVSVLMGAPKPFDDFAIASPEFAGMRTVIRTIWPWVVASAGMVPIVLARAAVKRHVTPIGPAVLGASLVLALFVLVAGWIRFRADIKAWWRLNADAAMNPSKAAAARAEQDNR
jgi:hypothetical protein